MLRKYAGVSEDNLGTALMNGGNVCRGRRADSRVVVSTNDADVYCRRRVHLLVALRCVGHCKDVRLLRGKQLIRVVALTNEGDVRCGRRVRLFLASRRVRLLRRCWITVEEQLTPIIAVMNDNARRKN